MSEPESPSTPPPLCEALAVEPTGDLFRGYVHQGYDVFGIPHGGYLAAIGANAIMQASEAPDIFTLTTHYLRKAKFGPIALEVQRVGGSRRFTSWTAIARQGGEPVLSLTGSTGDRSTVDGPAWQAEALSPIPQEHLSPPSPDPAFAQPEIAHRGRLQLDQRTLKFIGPDRSDQAVLRAVLQFDPADQLAAIVACDATPPAAWNVLGMQGWVPTVELTCHVRARPVPGPFQLHVQTQHISAGFLEEDGLVYDASGRLVVQSRQLARWTA